MAIKPVFIIVDDHPLYRHGVSELIMQELHLELGGEAATVGDALKLLSETKPRVAIVDISLQGQNGLELVRSIKTDYPKTAVLVVSMHEESLYGERALRAGARGYVMKHEAPSALLSAIKTVLDGGIAVSEELRNRMLEGYVGGARDVEPIARLSDRELEVFTLIGKGCGAAEIASTLGISVKTVNAYRDHIKDKLVIKTAANLRKYAIEWTMSSESR